MWAYLRERKVAVDFTRSRPYHSDDNARVERKNWTWARQLLGDGRLEAPELVGPISARYREVWAPWQNFFLPCLKLERQWREGSHWRKRYEPPRTAYERLCAPGILSRQARSRLKERHASLNPFALKDEFERRLGQILRPAPHLKTVGRSWPPALRAIALRGEALARPTPPLHRPKGIPRRGS